MWIQVKVTEHEKNTARRVAKQYGTTVSELVRALILYADQKQPKLTFSVTMEPDSHKSVRK